MYSPFFTLPSLLGHACVIRRHGALMTAKFFVCPGLEKVRYRRAVRVRADACLTSIVVAQKGQTDVIPQNTRANNDATAAIPKEPHLELGGLKTLPQHRECRLIATPRQPQQHSCFVQFIEREGKCL